MKKPQISPKLIFIIIISIILLITLIIFLKYQNVKSQLDKNNQALTLETKELLAEIGNIIVLPQNEIPTIATVTDVDKLKNNQPLFNNAKNGDKVLIYSTKAIIYDPVIKKIIDIAQIKKSTQQDQNSTQSTQIKSPTPSIINKNQTTPTINPTTIPTSLNFSLLNGTKTIGLTKTYESYLKKSLPEAVIVQRGDAKGDYTKSIIVLINSSKANVSEQIAKTLNLPLNSLPEQENKPKDPIDFLIILGSDKLE